MFNLYQRAIDTFNANMKKKILQVELKLADVGKVLGIVNKDGKVEIVPVEGGGESTEILFVQGIMDGYSVTLDKTFNEISEALKKNAFIVTKVKDPNGDYPNQVNSYVIRMYDIDSVTSEEDKRYISFISVSGNVYEGNAYYPACSFVLYPNDTSSYVANVSFMYDS